MIPPFHAPEKAGFTLVEMLIVFSIIGILSAIILGSVHSAQVKGLDAKIEADMYNIRLGLLLYHDSTGHMPANKTSGGYCNDPSDFLSELVAAGYLPRSIQAPFSGIYYCYYDYGSGNPIGALLVTSLQAAAPTAGEYPGTCRPWAAGTNWCSMQSDTEYCVCNPY